MRWFRYSTFQQDVKPMRSAATLLTLSNVVVEHHGKTLLNGVTVSVSSSGMTAIMGFNGAGKSVLLKTMHGIVKPTQGDIHWMHRNNTHSRAPKQAMVFQKPVLLRRSVKANMDFVARIHGAHAENNIDSLLDSVGLANKAKQPARLLSGGEQQRLALARAIASNPEVLFLDEATASLDPASTQIIENRLQQLANKGMKIIFVTHNAGQAQRLAKDVVFVDNGTVAECSSAQDFFHSPESDAAIAYLSANGWSVSQAFTATNAR